MFSSSIFTTKIQFSKLFALTLFILLPTAGFYLGTLYQQKIPSSPNPDLTPSYYQTLRNQCKGNNCCLSSVKSMEDNSYKLTETGECPPGFTRSLLRCLDSLQWCQPASRQVPSQTPLDIQPLSPQSFCREHQGTWLDQYQECENLQSDQPENLCQEAGGTFSECEPNCRHDPDYPNVYCTQQCIPVCKF